MPLAPLRPFWRLDNLVKLYHGHVIDVLRRLPEKSVHMCVTSPPYWGLRDYGNDKTMEIGSERTPQEFVNKMVEVFREVRRVLRDDGTLWLNLGDSYNQYNGNRQPSSGVNKTVHEALQKLPAGYGLSDKSLAGGNLVGVPWRVALALQADGWILRQDIIWAKPSPMPESVKNRCTKAHEYVFLFAKRKDYFYDAEPIKEAATGRDCGDYDNKYTTKYEKGDTEEHRIKKGLVEIEARVRSNKRSVWRVATQGYPGAHFATFPSKLIEPMILAGTSEKGCCAGCGAPYRRLVEEQKLTRERPRDYVKRSGEEGTGNSCGNSVAGVETVTVGWVKTCRCETDEVAPCVVLDPFVGSGTTCCVALDNGRKSIGIDLSSKYLTECAIKRIEGVAVKERYAKFREFREVIEGEHRCRRSTIAGTER